MRHTNIFILALLFTLSAPLTTASAQKHVVTRSTAFPSEFWAKGLYYKVISITDRTCEVAQHYEYTGDIQIPRQVTYKGRTFTVTTIGREAFRDCESLTSITIPSSVTTIGDYAFVFCKSLTSITIPNSVTTIGGWAFEYCERLTGITIPYSVTTIGQAAFYGCTNLTSITIPSSVTTIGDNAFYGCTSLTSITIPSSVTTIGDYAFSECTSLKNIAIHNSVTTIGGWAFSHCTSLTGITIPNSVTTIEDDAFEYCTSLTGITIPSSVKAIGDCAFYGCESLKSITILNPNTVIGRDAFYGCPAQASIKEVVTSKPADNKVYQVVDQMPSFPGGDDALSKYISTHLKYPSRALEQGVEGKVVVRFVVTSSGNIGEIQIMRSVDTDIDKEAKRIVASLPKFNPGKQQGKPVPVWYVCPIDFRIDNTK